MDNEYFKGFLGNETALLLLSSAVKTGRASHCYMFCGEKGLGKHTLAKMFAKALASKKDATEADRKMADMISHSYDISDKKYIAPIVAEIK